MFAAKTAMNPALIAELKTFFESKPTLLQGGGGAAPALAAAAAAAAAADGDIEMVEAVASAAESDAMEEEAVVVAVADISGAAGRPRRQNAGRRRSQSIG